MTIDELVAKHGRVRAEDLPKRNGPKFGTRVFEDDGEEKIFLYVEHERNSPELAAVLCATTKATVYSVMQRVRLRLGIEKAPPPSRQGAEPSTSTSPEGSVTPIVTDFSKTGTTAKGTYALDAPEGLTP